MTQPPTISPAALIDAVGRALIATDVTGKVVLWNRCAERLYGWNAAEALGRDIARLNVAEQAEAEARQIMERLRAGESWTGEFLVRRRDGSTFTAAVTDTPVRDATGALTGIVGVSHDADARVADLIRERDAALDAKRRGEESLAILGHELLSPLAAITSALEVACMDATAFRPTVAQRQVRHMARLIEDILDVSGLQRGGITMRMQAIDLREVVLRALDLTVSAIEEKGQVLDVMIPPGESLLVEGDPDRLVQVLSNLLGNASRYTGPGGSIGLRLSMDPPHAVLSVSDTGRGIPPEDRGRIFDPFTRGTDRERASDRGLGIGLTLVRAIVELHHGQVTVSSEGRGRGTEFTVRLPLST